MSSVVVTTSDHGKPAPALDIGITNLKRIIPFKEGKHFHNMEAGGMSWECYGELFATKCTKCDFRGNIGDEFSDLPPSVQDMWKLLVRPDVVWFGESIKQEVWKEAVKQSMTCDVMIIYGGISYYYVWSSSLCLHEG